MGKRYKEEKSEQFAIDDQRCYFVNIVTTT